MEDGPYREINVRSWGESRLSRLEIKSLPWPLSRKGEPDETIRQRCKRRRTFESFRERSVRKKGRVIALPHSKRKGSRVRMNSGGIFKMGAQKKIWGGIEKGRKRKCVHN